MSVNTGTLASGTSATQIGAVWTVLQNSGSAGANELRFSDVSTQGATPSATWPYMTRPGATGQVNFQYAFTADTTSLGYLGSTTVTPTTWLNANFNDVRWQWDALGTFASAPIITSFPTTGHGAITRSDGTLLGGSTADTGGTSRSYLKGNLWGRVTSAGAPGVAPTGVPLVTDGTTGTLSPTAGANWIANYQGLQGTNDFLTFAAIPAATTADSIQWMLTLFTGPNMLTGTYTWPISLQYTFA